MRGRGALHFLVLHLSFGGASIALRFQEPGDQSWRNEGRTPVKVTTLRVRLRDGIQREPQEWSDKAGLKLEAQLTEIVTALLRQAELTLRANEKRRFEFCQERRQELLAKIEARKLEDERQRLAAIEAHGATVRDEIIAIAGRFRTAEDIRETVAALRKHPGVTHDFSRFEVWATRALEVANSLDPMACPLEQVLRPFGTARTG